MSVGDCRLIVEGTVNPPPRVGRGSWSHVRGDALGLPELRRDCSVRLDLRTAPPPGDWRSLSGLKLGASFIAPADARRGSVRRPVRVREIRHAESAAIELCVGKFQDLSAGGCALQPARCAFRGWISDCCFCCPEVVVRLCFRIGGGGGVREDRRLRSQRHTNAIIRSSTLRSTPLAGFAFCSPAWSALLPGTESSHAGGKRSRRCG